VEDNIEATEVLHNTDSADLHFRFMGIARNRTFVVNVQFGTQCEASGEGLKPIEQDFLITKILGLLLEHIAKTPNAGLH